jgi:hypothetical protein
VPYNPFLLKKYQMHINVEMCNTAMASKYLFKYITKGSDRMMAKVDESDENARNEIRDYEDLRSIGATEACWRTFMFETNQVCPNVQALPIHLENGQRIPFREGDETLAAQAGPPETELTMWFHYNRTKHRSERPALYPDFPTDHVWNRSSKTWTKRKQPRTLKTIGRVYNVHPLMGELYYLRLLLHDNHSLGARSFLELKQIGRPHSQPAAATYRDVCLQLGLLEDDGEWRQAMQEAVHTQFPPTIRQLFCTILEWCNPSNPSGLFEEFKVPMGDDYQARYENHPTFSNEVKYAMVTLDIERRLQERHLTLQHYGFPNMTEELRRMCTAINNELRAAQQSSLRLEQIHYDCAQESAAFEHNYAKLEPDQKLFVDHVISSIDNKQGKVFFLDAVAGAGKTFCENILLSRFQARKKIAFGVATTGMASTQLKNGRTAQSELHLPITTEENCTWNISAQSEEARLLIEAEYILWDEATMAHRHLVEALDTGLRDITKIDRPFGGKTIILAGDYRQTLPVIKHGSRAQIVNATLKRSRLWNHNIEKHHFLINRRLRLHGINPEAEDYAEWLLTVGNGTAPTTSNGTYDDLITIPDHILFEGDVNDLANWVFPDIESYDQLDSDWICHRAVLTPKNENVNYINNLMMDRFPGDGSDEIVAQSADTLSQDFENAGIPNEYLNTLNPSGFPPHRLRLKVGMPLILLRNLNPSEGLSNGTKLRLERIHNHMIEAKIIGGDHNGNIVCLPRILLKPKDGDYPFQWTRRQFPVNVAFAITINKSQGQTLSKVGIYLPEPCFAHGQLYTALSRVSHPQDIRVMIVPGTNSQSHNQTRNIVYTEILEHNA